MYRTHSCNTRTQLLLFPSCGSLLTCWVPLPLSSLVDRTLFCLVILFPMGVGGRDALYSPKSSKSSCLSIWIMRLQKWTPTPSSLRCLCKAEDFSYLDKLHSLNVNYVLISGFPDLSRFSLNHTYSSTYLKLLNLLKATKAQWQELACGIPPSLAAAPWAMALLFLSGFRARSLKLLFGFFLQFLMQLFLLSKSHISN